MRIFLAAALLLIASSYSLAQSASPIVMAKTSFTLMEPIEIGIDLGKIDSTVEAESFSCDWETDATTGNKILDNGLRLHAWSLPGDHTGNVVVAYIKDGKLQPIKRYPFAYRVEGSVLPDPNDATDIRILAGKDAAKLIEMYGPQASALDNDVFVSFEEYDAVAKGRAVANGLNNNKVTGIVRDRIAKVKPWNGPRAAAVLREAIKQLGGEAPAPEVPDPPKPDVPVVQGKPTLIILAETSEYTPELNTIVSRFQTMGPEYDWMKAKGWKTRAYDPQQEQNNQPIPLVQKLVPLNPLPEAYMVDDAGNVLGHMDLITNGTAATTAAQVLETLVRKYE